MTSKTVILDADARQMALDIGRSFAVAAPAGSGKTGLLTQRVLKLLAHVQNPEEILCLTFTRKAAGEMRKRIHTALIGAQAPEPEDPFEKQTWLLANQALENDKLLGWQLLQSPNRLRITTIDGYCRLLARQMVLESGVGEDMATEDNPGALYRLAISDLFNTYLQSDSDIGEALRQLVIHQDNDLEKLAGFLVALLQKRDQWLAHLMQSRDARERLESYLKETIESALHHLSLCLAPYAGLLLQLAHYAGGNLVKDGKEQHPLAACSGMTAWPATDFSTVAQWQGLVQLLVTQTGSLRKPGGVDRRLGFPTKKEDPELGEIRKQQIKQLLADLDAEPEELRRILAAIDDVRHLPLPGYPDEQWQVLASLTIVLPILVARLSSLFQEQNLCDFTEITLAALRSLGSEEEPTNLALKLDYRIRHILVDEFQDTSTIQHQLLRSLTRGWQVDDGRSLFIVGDGMQSLYGFRNANVGLFLEARSMPLGSVSLTPLDLVTNFRSQQGIVAWVNEAFAKSFPAEDNISRGAVAYAPSRAHKQALPEPAVSIDAFMDFQGYQAEAERVLEIILKSRTDNPDGTIAILVRDRSYLRHLLPILRSGGLTWTARDIEPLASQMEVLDLVSLTRAMLCPADRIAWLAVLRAPWCGLDLKDLYHLTNQPLQAENPCPGGARLPLILLQLANWSKIKHLSPEGRQILERVAPLLLETWENRQRYSLRQAIEALWVNLGGEQICKLRESYANCQAYLNLLEQHEVAATIDDWESFYQAVSRLYAEPAADVDPNLQIMTIHKAKGLEFDTVIIPGLNKKSAASENPLLLWREGLSDSGDAQLIISAVAASSDVDKDVIYQHLKHEQNLKEKLENTRVLYVAATRAIKRLHLLFSKRTDSSPGSGSLLETLWPWLGEQLENPDPQENATFRINHHQAPEDGDMEIESGNGKLPFSSTLTRLQASTSMPYNFPLDSQAATGDENPADSDSADTEATLTGTLLHRLIRQITVEGLANWRKTHMEKRTAFWSMQLKQMGSLEPAKNIKLIESAIHTLLEDKEHYWLFDHNHEDSQCEYSIDYRDKRGRICTSVIDRTFVAEETSGVKVRWIIDYKLSQPLADEPLSDFIRRQKELYKKQLGHYAWLMGLGEKLPQRTALYFPLLGKLAVLDSD